VDAVVGDGYAVERIDDIEAIMGGAFRKARAALGVTSFGIQVIELPPNFERYPEHDHADDGEEEVFAVLRGGGEIEIAGERHPLDPEHLVRVAPGAAARPTVRTSLDAAHATAWGPQPS